MPAEGAFNHACVHDVGSRGPSGERADRAGLAVIERFDAAPGQQPGQQSLASPPRQDCATTGAGTVGTSRSASRAR